MDKDSDFVFPKSSKKRKNKRFQNELAPLSFAHKLDREAGVINTHTEWLENTRGTLHLAL
jgi:hypothetical protein